MTQDKIIKFFDRQGIYSENEGKNIGIVVDTETTGLEDDAEVVEICILPFSFNDDLEICKVFKPYVGFEQPSKPLTEEIKKITNLTDEMLEGKNFEDHQINSLYSKAEVCIAHNARFDRKKMESRFPTLKKVVWACSMNDPDWRGDYFTARSLDYIAYRFGFWFEHHRAENDCRATLHALSFKMSDGRTGFQSMMEKAFTPEVKLYVKSDFSQKDILKGRGYSWDGTAKAWNKAFDEEGLETELEFISERMPTAETQTKQTDLKKRYA